MTQQEQAVPFSVQALREYRDGLRSLSDDCEQFHRELLDEIEGHMDCLDSVVLHQHFRRWKQDHQEALAEMLGRHRDIAKEVDRQIAKEHPGLPK